MAALQRRGLSLSEHLERLRERYGPLEYRTSYFIAPNPAASRAVFERLRADGCYARVHAFSRPSDYGGPKKGFLRALSVDGQAEDCSQCSAYVVCFSITYVAFEGQLEVQTVSLRLSF